MYKAIENVKLEIAHQAFEEIDQTFAPGADMFDFLSDEYIQMAMYTSAEIRRLVSYINDEETLGKAVVASHIYKLARIHAWTMLGHKIPIELEHFASRRYSIITSYRDRTAYHVFM